MNEDIDWQAWLDVQAGYIEGVEPIMADSQDTTRPKASGNQADNPTTGSVPSQLHKTPYVAFPTVEDLPKAYKASKVKKSGRGRRFNGKHND